MEQEAGLPPYVPEQVQVQGPEPETDGVELSKQRLVVGWEERLAPLEEPQEPATGVLVAYPVSGVYVYEYDVERTLLAVYVLPSSDSYVYTCPEGIAGRFSSSAVSKTAQLVPIVQESGSSGYSPCIVLYIRRALLIEARLAFISASLADLIAPDNWTKTKPDKIPIIAIATRSSIKVNAFF